MKKNKFRKKLMIERHKEFLHNLDVLTKQFDTDYPGWEKTDDADYIKKKLNKTAKIQTQNRLKRKLKHLKKSDFKDWPFKSDSIILVQTSKLWISCIVEGHEYALNGLAQTGLGIPFAHDKGIAKKGESIGEFIQMGLKL